jgi:hypothetical protein
MKKLLLLLAVLTLATACHFAPAARAQSASFSYTPASVGPIQPGGTFSININVVFTSGASINNLAGFSFFMWQASPAGPYPFSITGRNVSGSPFQFGNVNFPLVLDPIGRSPGGGSGDLGGLAPAGSPFPSGTYFLGTYTFSIASNAAPGTYSIGSTTPATPGVGGRSSVIVDTDGDTFAIADSRFNVTVVPEPGTWALLSIGALLGGAAGARRRFSRR